MLVRAPESAAAVEFPALGTTARLVVPAVAALADARRVLQAEVAALDAACSRFRPDSELSRVNAAPGRMIAIGPLLTAAVAVALRAAEATGGLVDPTVGPALRAVGYDRDFAAVQRRGGRIRIASRPAAGWRAVEFDEGAGTLRLPLGVTLDLGATAKAFAADRAASLIGANAGGALVSLGGDVAVAGNAPLGGWPVGVADDRHGGPAETVAIRSGGLATSSTTVRSWTRNGRTLHHIIDPLTGLPAPPVWRTVTVAAASCLDANIASTAALVCGRGAPQWLAGRDLPGRLAGTDGSVRYVGGWPEPTGANP